MKTSYCKKSPYQTRGYRKKGTKVVAAEGSAQTSTAMTMGDLKKIVPLDNSEIMNLVENIVEEAKKVAVGYNGDTIKEGVGLTEKVEESTKVAVGYNGETINEGVGLTEKLEKKNMTTVSNSKNKIYHFTQPVSEFIDFAEAPCFEKIVGNKENQNKLLLSKRTAESVESDNVDFEQISTLKIEHKKICKKTNGKELENTTVGIPISTVKENDGDYNLKIPVVAYCRPVTESSFAMDKFDKMSIEDTEPEIPVITQTEKLGNEDDLMELNSHLGIPQPEKFGNEEDLQPEKLGNEEDVLMEFSTVGITVITQPEKLCDEEYDMELKSTDKIPVVAYCRPIMNSEKNDSEIIQVEDLNEEEEDELLIFKTTYEHSLFLQEPFHGDGLFVTANHVEELSGPHWLSTGLLDYLIKWGIPYNKSKSLIIPTSAIESVMDLFLRKSNSSKDDEQKWFVKKREEMQRFSEKEFKFIICSCMTSHYFVITMDFDATDPSEQIFKNITVYDSIKRTINLNKISNRSEAGKFLKKFQQFLLRFVLYNSQVQKKLFNNNEYILEKGIYKNCPQQSNMHDCGLFAFAIVLHLSRDKEVNENTFTQANITYLHQALHVVMNAPASETMPDPKQVLSRTFLSSFFENTYVESVKPDPFLLYLRSQHDVSNAYWVGENDWVDDNGSVNSANSKPKPEETLPSALQEEQEEVHNEGGDNETNENIQYHDDIFHHMFVDNNTSFKNATKLAKVIEQYQESSENRLRIEKSIPDIHYYLYTCRQHIGCTFRASFGLDGSHIILKNRNLVHSGITRGPVAKGGRKHKSRQKGTLKRSIKTLYKIKNDPPTTKDVIKASRAIENKNPTYGQAYKQLKKFEQEQCTSVNDTFQLIIPYLEEFGKNNPGSVIDYQRKEDNSFERFFLCPGIMNDKLGLVRPIISVDAAHMRCESKGTLYLATVKSSNNEIIPVAISIMADNENHSGWVYFLENLKKSCPIISTNHNEPKYRPYKLFTFVSDRDKGLIEACRVVFPNNHHTHCQVHIRRNVKKNFGKKAGSYVPKIGTTFSNRKEDYWFSKLKQLHPLAFAYVENISPTTWRSVAWMSVSNLPRRYGITSSNDAESANSMFHRARDLNWVDALDSMLDIITTRITKFRNQYNGKKGTIQRVQQNITKMYNHSTTCTIIEIEENAHIYKVTQVQGARGKRAEAHVVNIADKFCSCGEWQEHEIPCIHAITYFRRFEDLSVDEILDEKVSKLYSFGYLNRLYRRNLYPVVTENLVRDNITLPPDNGSKRQPGRPQELRIRNRSKYVNLEDSPIQCSKCDGKGHNARTCDLRQLATSLGIDYSTVKPRKNKQTVDSLM